MGQLGSAAERRLLDGEAHALGRATDRSEVDVAQAGDHRTQVVDEQLEGLIVLVVEPAEEGGQVAGVSGEARRAGGGAGQTCGLYIGIEDAEALEQVGELADLQRSFVGAELLQGRQPGGLLCEGSVALARALVVDLHAGPIDRDPAASSGGSLELELLATYSRATARGDEQDVVIMGTFAGVPRDLGLHLDPNRGPLGAPSPKQQRVPSSVAVDGGKQILAGDVSEEADHLEEVGLARGVGSHQDVERAERDVDLRQRSEVLDAQRMERDHPEED